MPSKMKNFAALSILWPSLWRLLRNSFHKYIHKSFIKKMTERVNLTMKKWTKCNENT